MNHPKPEERGLHFQYMCDAYVDQEKMTGPNPVGYKCSRPATYEIKSGHLLCESCGKMLGSEEFMRLSLPSIGFGYKHQEQLIRKTVENMHKALSKLTPKSE